MNKSLRLLSSLHVSFHDSNDDRAGEESRNDNDNGDINPHSSQLKPESLRLSSHPTPVTTPTSVDADVHDGVAAQLESNLLLAVTSLRSAIEEIEAAQLAPKAGRKQGLIVAACSLGLAIKRVEEAEATSKKEVLQESLSDVKTWSTFYSIPEGHESTDEEEDEDDYSCGEDSTIFSQDTATVAERETQRVLYKLRQEETSLRRMYALSICLRRQEEHDPVPSMALMSDEDQEEPEVFPMTTAKWETCPNPFSTALDDDGLPDLCPHPAPVTAANEIP